MKINPLYEWVGEKVAKWGDELMGDGYSYVGAVVGATYPEMGKVLRKLMPKTFILVPGYQIFRVVGTRSCTFL